jgi:hypothetical protein
MVSRKPSPRKRSKQLPRPRGHPAPVRGAENWQLFCDRATFDTLRGNVAFHRLLDLARHINALRYAISASGAAIGDDTPNGDRQRLGTFYYLGGVLFEAIGLVPELRPHFESHRAWKKGFAHYGDDDAIRARVKKGGDLQRLRNHTSFHFLPMVSERSLARLQLDEYTFTSGLGPSRGFVYHNLADAVGVHYLAGAPTDGERFAAEVERLATMTMDMALEYITHGSNLIGGTLIDFGFQRRGNIFSPEQSASQRKPHNER